MPDNFKRENYIHEKSDSEFHLSHLIDEGDYTVSFHTHNFIEVYLSVSGGKHFIIDDQVYNIEPGDLFISNMTEVHRVIAQKDEIYERYVFEFKPTFALPYCTSKTDLLHYVYRRQNNFSNKLSLTKCQQQEITALIRKYEQINDKDYAGDVLRRLYYIEMLAFIAKVYSSPSNPVQNPVQKSRSRDSMEVVSNTLEYISANLTGDLSLDNISRNIGFSKYHLCKIFKEKTGTTINQYVVTRRIAEAKYILAAGDSVTNACHNCGFNDMSHFVRTFHNIVGISPGKFSSEMMYENTYYRGAEK